MKNTNFTKDFLQCLGLFDLIAFLYKISNPTALKCLDYQSAMRCDVVHPVGTDGQYICYNT